MKSPFQVVKDFEQAVAEYTGAPYVVAVNSCSAALMLAVAWHLRLREIRRAVWNDVHHVLTSYTPSIEIPKRTYLSVPMSIIHAGGRPTFRDEDWQGWYQLKPLPVWDSARYFSSGMYQGWNGKHPTAPGGWPHAAGGMVCTSHHWSKTLGIQQGGCILHHNPQADKWLRMARFDGRQEGVAPKDQKEWIIGHHCYMSPEVAAAGIARLHFLPKHNKPMPNDDYPDLSQLEIFK